MNERGWAVGRALELSDDDFFQTAVMWRDGDVIDLGLGGGLVPRGSVNSIAVDVNEDGVVAAQRWRNGGGRSHTSWLWQDGVKERLRGSRQRPRAYVEAVNDDGVAVGYITGRGSKPVVWRNGARERLPVPTGASGYAVGINNRGLVVGTVTPRGGTYDDARFWYWRLDRGSGPLDTPAGYPMQMIDVDNRNRILGQVLSKRSAFVLWKGPGRRGRVLGRTLPPGENGATIDHPVATDLNDHGDLTGYRGGFRGSGEEPWVSHLGARRPTSLPPPEVEGGYASSTEASAVIRGVTWFAPQGGVSVAGYFEGYLEGDFGDPIIEVADAVIWTCTQTYRATG